MTALSSRATPSESTNASCFTRIPRSAPIARPLRISAAAARQEPPERQLVQRAENGSLGGARRDRRVQLATFLTLADNLPDQLQVGGPELLPIGGLEELRALAQFHHQDGGEIGVLLH